MSEYMLSKKRLAWREQLVEGRLPDALQASRQVEVCLIKTALMAIKQAEIAASLDLREATLLWEAVVKDCLCLANRVRELEKRYTCTPDDSQGMWIESAFEASQRTSLRSLLDNWSSSERLPSSVSPPESRREAG